jgi:hypothetical protein
LYSIHSTSKKIDRALFPGYWNKAYFQTPSSEASFAAAKEAIAQDLVAMHGFHWMRTCALTALCVIHVGKLDIMYQYMVLYHSILAMNSLQDEKN